MVTSDANTNRPQESLQQVNQNTIVNESKHEPNPKKIETQMEVPAKNDIKWENLFIGIR